MPVRKPRLRLLESTRHTTMRAVGTHVGSALAQIGMVAGAFTGCAAYVASQPIVAPEDVPSFIAPLKRLSPRPVQEQVSYVGLPSAELPSLGEKIAARDDGRTPVAVRRDGGELIADPNAPTTEAEDQSRPLSEIEVDSTVARDPESAGPEYPEAMLMGRIEGGVLARFVVDTSGRADSVSFKVVQSTDTAFVLAVRAVLPRMKYRPAFLNGKRVAQLVEQYFTFKITPPGDGQDAARDAMVRVPSATR